MSFNIEQVEALRADLARQHVAQRTQSGRQLSYLEGWHVEAEANRIFGFHGWDSTTLETRMVAENARKIGASGADGWGVSYVARVRVTVTTPDGETVIRDGVGAGHGIDRDLGLAHESAIKEACTDAEKRALKTFGNPFGLALYDKTQAHVSDGRPAEPKTLSGALGGRKSSASAKRDGDDAKIKSDIAKADRDGIRDWHENFDSYTAHLPVSWLDSVRDMLEHRLEDLNGGPGVDDNADEMDESYRQTVAA
jgi:DNA recombination protein Rad52